MKVALLAVSLGLELTLLEVREKKFSLCDYLIDFFLGLFLEAALWLFFFSGSGTKCFEDDVLQSSCP